MTKDNILAQWWCQIWAGFPAQPGQRDTGQRDRGSVTMENVIWALAVIAIAAIVVAAITAYVQHSSGLLGP